MPLLPTGQQALHTRQRGKPVIDFGSEILEVAAPAQGPHHHRLDDRHQVPRPVLQLGNEHLLVLLKLNYVVYIRRCTEPFDDMPIVVARGRRAREENAI